MIMRYLVFILLFSTIYSEKFVYSVGFRLLNVGQATISSTIEDESSININTLIKSNKFLDRLYRVRDQIDLVVDAGDYSLKKIEKNIVEGNWKQNYSAQIDSNNNIISKDSLIQNEKLLFDPISVLYSLRTKDLKSNDKYEYHILGEDEIKSLTTEVRNNETVKVPAGKYNCIKVVPYSNNSKNIFKENGYMTVWFSNDKKKIPVKIELKTNIGNLVLKLKKILP